MNLYQNSSIACIVYERMLRNMKIIAFYLPQFHEIPENNEWWGKGFTEWVNVKKAEPLYEGHYQPRIPLNNNYYDLSDKRTQEWQVKIAKDHGVYGFCFYHYWFDGHLLLEKPTEEYLKNKDLDLPFCICWANEHWTKAWVSKEDSVLIAQKYGGPTEWEEHFNYLLPFLKDERYIYENGKPLIIIYRPEIIDCLNEMLDCWTRLAIENGFEGINFAYQHIGFDLNEKKDDSRFAFNIEYQPTYGNYQLEKDKFKSLKKMKRAVTTFLENKMKLDLRYIRKPGLIVSDYDKTWEAILEMRPSNDKSIPGAFVDWDNTPRRGSKGRVYEGATPDKFQKYLSEQIIRARDVYKKDFIFLFAWNEWAEGGYIEPDEKFGYGYLQAIKKALIENNEFPKYK